MSIFSMNTQTSTTVILCSKRNSHKTLLNVDSVKDGKSIYEISRFIKLICEFYILII